MNNRSDRIAAASGETLFTRSWIVFFIAAVTIFGALSVGGELDWADASRSCEEFANWSRSWFAFPNEDSSRSWILGPALFTLVLAASLRLVSDRPPDWLRLPVGVGFLTLQVAYLGFRLVATLS